MHAWQSSILALSSLCLWAQVQEPVLAPPSTIVAPIRIDLAPLFNAAERSTPITPPGVETWINLPGKAGASPVYKFNLFREPLYFVLKGNRVVMHTTVDYWFEVGVRVNTWVKSMGSCGLPPESFRKARLGLQAEFALTPDWCLDLKLTPEDPLSVSGCQITFLGYDITDKVLAGMKENLVKATQALTAQIQQTANLKARAESAWLQALQPVELAPDVFLLLNPERVRLSPWTSEGKTLTILPEIQIRPTVTLGARPQVAPRPLPPLDLAPAPFNPGFNLQVDADLSYEHAARQLFQQVGGKPIQTEKGTFEVTKVAIQSKDGFAYLHLDLKGKVTGHLVLKGRPVFNEQLGTLNLEDLDYTLETKNWITSFGEWLYRGTLRKTLTEKCSFFLDKSLKDLKEKTEQGLNRPLSPQVTLAGALDTFHVSRVELMEDRFKVVARLEGALQILVKPGQP
jgi:hypothetical protein